MAAPVRSSNGRATTVDMPDQATLKTDDMSLAPIAAAPSGGANSQMPSGPGRHPRPLQRVGSELRRAREHARLAPDEVSRATGIAPDQLVALELGAIAPLLSEVVTLTRFYGIDLDSLGSPHRHQTQGGPSLRPPTAEVNSDEERSRTGRRSETSD